MQIKLDKATFNSFDINKQVKYFNEELEKGFTILEVCNKINISYNTIRDRFLRNNYIYNKTTKKYEIGSSILSSLESETIDKVLESLVRKSFNTLSYILKERLTTLPLQLHEKLLASMLL